MIKNVRFGFVESEANMARFSLGFFARRHFSYLMLIRKELFYAWYLMIPVGKMSLRL